MKIHIAQIIVSVKQGPRSKILSGGLKRERGFFMGRGGGGGGGGGGGMLPWENYGFSYSQISEGGFKINKQCIKAKCFYNLKHQGFVNKNGTNVPGSARDY